MQVGTDVWVKNTQLDIFNHDIWVASTVVSKNVAANGDAVITVDRHIMGRAETTYTLAAGQFELPELKYRNSAQHQLLETNLNNLHFLNEAEVLTALRARYQRNVLSTYIGQVLLHINPLRSYSTAESREADVDCVLEKFALDVKNHTTMEPAMWDAACKYMQSQGSMSKKPSDEDIAAGHAGGLLAILQDNLAQLGDEAGSGKDSSPSPSSSLGHSIIINGESGSGKTETARALLRHLLRHSAESDSIRTTSSTSAFTLNRNSVSGTGFTAKLVDKIVQANVLLDAMGCARLCRNYNSSRFGKYLELGFDSSQNLVGAYIRTYLLESVLVCKQSPDESNFHVFYQLVRGSKATERVKWGLGNDCAAYYYLNQNHPENIALSAANNANNSCNSATPRANASSTSTTPRPVSSTTRPTSTGVSSTNGISVVYGGNSGGVSSGSSKNLTPKSKSSENLAAALVDEAVHQRDKDENAEQDVDGFAALKAALQFLGVSTDVTQQFFNAIAGILHLGQVEFDSVTDLSGDSGVVSDQQPLLLAGKLLGIPAEQLEVALTKKKSLVIRGEVFSKSLSAAQAASTRDVVARHIYRRVFDWALTTVNDCLHPSSNSGDAAGTDSQLASCVGILDIFGFECLAKNSFEQLCINYSSEVLHKHFCESAFAQEIVEYQKEGISYTEVTYKRKSPLIKLIGVDIMAMLDEQCRLPNPSDGKLLSKLNKKYSVVSTSPAPATPAAAGVATAAVSSVGSVSVGSKLIRLEENDFEDNLFRVTHYAQDVVYSINGFIDKHFDEVPAAVESMLQTSTSVVLNAAAGSESGNNGASPLRDASVNPVKRSGNTNLGTYFRDQLALLLEQIKLTVPHFVRCVKASDRVVQKVAVHAGNTSVTGGNGGGSINPLLKKSKRPTSSTPGSSSTGSLGAAATNAPFNGVRVMEQLRTCGVMETLQTNRNWFRVKAPLRDFYLRYRCMVPADHPLAADLPSFLTVDRDSIGSIHDDTAGPVKECTARLMTALLSCPTLRTTLAGRQAAGDKVMHWQQGISAVFLTVTDHDNIECARFQVLESTGAALAVRLAAFAKRLHYLRMLSCIRNIQRVGRGHIGRHKSHQRRRFLSAVVSLQRRHRNSAYIHDALRRLRVLVKALLTVQKCGRRFCARRMVQRLKVAREHYLATSGNLLTAKEMRLARRRGEVQFDRDPIPPVPAKMQDYRTLEIRLLQEINSMIHGTKVTTQNALVRFDVKETRKVVADWAAAAEAGALKTNLTKLSVKLDYGCRLLRPAALIPMVHIGCLGVFQSTHAKKRQAVHTADKIVNKEHLVFAGIVKLQKVIEEVLRIAFNDRKDSLTKIDAIKKDLVRNIRKYGADFTRTKATPYYVEIQRNKDFIIVADNIMRFGLVLYKYYTGFVTVIVAEYGEHSAYRRNFKDDELYLLSLQQLVETTTDHLHYSEQFLQMTNPDPGMDVCADFPLKLIDGANLAIAATTQARGSVQLYQDVYYKFMPYAPGVDFAVNSFLQFLCPVSIAPSRLLRLSGKSSDNYGQCTYYQASMGFSEQTLSDVLDNPVLIERLNPTELSAAILTSLLTGAGDCRPENFMVKYVRKGGNYGVASEVVGVEILGVSTDPVFGKTAFNYDRIADAYSNCRAPNVQDLLAQREKGNKEAGVGFNVLFFLPQMDEPVDPEICKFFKSTASIPEEVVCSWLKFMYQQNKRYEALRISGGFTPDDFTALNLPIKIPLGAAIRVLQRLQELREHLTAIDATKLTHHALLSFWYPQLGEYYKEWRFSANKAHLTDAELDLVPSSSVGAASCLPLDSEDPLDRSIREEMQSEAGISGQSKRAFFVALTPYHKLYHNAVAQLEGEVTAILQAKASVAAAAANPPNRNSAAHVSSQLGTIREVWDESETESHVEDAAEQDTVDEDRTEEGGDGTDAEEGASEQDGAEGGFGSADEGDGEGDGDEQSQSQKSQQLNQRSPKSAQSRSPARASPDGDRTSSKKLNGKKQTTNIGGFDNIYGEVGSDQGDEYYAYEDAPDMKATAKTLRKSNRNDEKSRSFYKHKQVAAMFSPLVTMDLYPHPAAQPDSPSDKQGSFYSRQQSLRFDNLYETHDFAHDDTLHDLSEAEQSVMYIRPAGKAVNITSSLPNKTNAEAAKALVSPLVTRGDNPMAHKARPLPASPVTPVSRMAEVEETVAGGNPMQLKKQAAAQRTASAANAEAQDEEEFDGAGSDSGAGEDAREGEVAEDSEFEDEWRVEADDGEQSEHSGSMQDDNGSDDDGFTAITAATPSPIPDVALQFLMSIDFRRFDAAVSKSVCRVIGDSLAFLETLWLRYISEDQLKYMFEGYYEQKRTHRVTTALTSTTGAIEEEAATTGEIYATKEIKLIGISADIFKRLQRTTTINRMRRILGIQVSLVIIDGGDDSFVNVLSSASCETSITGVSRGVSPVPTTDAQIDAARVLTSAGGATAPTEISAAARSQISMHDTDSEDEGMSGPADRSCYRKTIDFPERYTALKHRTKLVLSSYTNMVGSMAPETISHNSTIIREVVRLSATVEGARTLNVTLANQFGLIFLEFPGFARIGKELADRGVFNQTNRILHRLLTHAQIERYLDVVYSILEQTPSVLLLRDRGDSFLPCDRVKALSEGKSFKYTLLSRFINAIPNINTERGVKTASATAIAAVAALNGADAESKSEQGSNFGAPLSQSGTATPVIKSAEEKLTGDELFLSIYAGEEELIVRALHFNLYTTAAEVKAKKYDLTKIDAETGQNIFHKCILCYADEPYIFNSAIETFKIALRVLRDRVISGELTQVAAEKMLFSTTTMAGETAWTLAFTLNTRPMIELITTDWVKTGELCGAPAEAIALSPAKKKKAKVSPVPATDADGTVGPTNLESLLSAAATAASDSRATKNGAQGLGLGQGLSLDIEGDEQQNGSLSARSDGSDENGEEKNSGFAANSSVDGSVEGSAEAKTEEDSAGRHTDSARSSVQIDLMEVEAAEGDE